MTGCQHYLAFGTATKFALDAAQKADQTVDVTLGYDRVEVAAIPAPKDDAGPSDDTYSVLGTFEVSYGNPFTEPLILRQVFATGMAAREAATSPGLREAFGEKAGMIASRNQQTIAERSRR